MIGRLDDWMIRELVDLLIRRFRRKKKKMSRAKAQRRRETEVGGQWSELRVWIVTNYLMIELTNHRVYGWVKA
jgi:hypothetical protein